jgi:hypothetical protein
LADPCAAVANDDSVVGHLGDEGATQIVVRKEGFTGLDAAYETAVGFLLAARGDAGAP